MMINSNEEAILRKIQEAHIANKGDLISLLRNNGTNKPIEALKAAVHNLEEKDLIRSINPLSSACFVITKKGLDFVKDL